MGYLEQSLGPNETFIYKARFHWLYYAAGWLALILLVASIGWIVISAVGWIEVALLGACAIGLILLLRNMLPIWTTEIGVTNHRLIVKRG